MVLLRTSVVLLTFAFLSPGCGGTTRDALADRHRPMPTRIIREANRGETVELRAGETVEVRLVENPTTGFRWTVEGGDERIVSLVASVYSPGPTSAPGAGGERVFTFEGKRPGVSRLRLRLWRPWEGKVSEEFELTVEVKG
jgi:inhibitor of cysteine peptidase